MNRIFNPYNLLRAALFVAAVVISVWLLPRKGRNSYHYELGKPWAYSLLTAPSDMPIYLDSISAQRVLDSIDVSFVPVYVRDISREKQAQAAYATRVNATNVGLSPPERNRLINALRNVLDNGIVDQETYQEIRSGRLPAIRFIHDNTAMTMPTSTLLSARAAYAAIDSMFQGDEYRKAIERTAMSQFLVSNIICDTAVTNRLRGGSAESDGSARGDTAGRAHNRQGRCGDSRTILAAAHLREDCRTEIGVAGRFPPLSHTRSDIVRDYYILGSVLFSDLFFATARLPTTAPWCS